VGILLFVLAAASASMGESEIWIPRSPDADPLYRILSKKDEGRRHRKAGYIDSTGKIVIPFVVPYWGGNVDDEFHDGRLEVATGDGVYIDTHGHKAIHRRFYRGWDFSEGLAAALEKDGGKWGYIKTNGQFAITPRFPSYPNGHVSSFAEGLTAIETEGKVGYIDRTGSFVIPQKFLYGGSFHDGMAIVVVEGPCFAFLFGDLVPLPAGLRQSGALCKYSFIDRAGSILSGRFDGVEDFSEGVAPIQVGKLWGYVDKSGTIVVPPRFSAAVPFSDGLALVSEGSLYGYIDHTGSYVIRPQFKDAESFAEGLAVVGEPFRCWYIDRSGNRAIPGEFVVASPFFKGVAHVKPFTGTDDDKGWVSGSHAYIDRSGKIIFREDD